MGWEIQFFRRVSSKKRKHTCSSVEFFLILSKNKNKKKSFEKLHIEHSE